MQKEVKELREEVAIILQKSSKDEGPVNIMTAPKIPDPTPKNEAKWWLEPVGKDLFHNITIDGKIVSGKLGSRVYLDKKNTPGCVTRYWFKLTPGSSKQVNMEFGLHHLNPVE